jgi:hypothetical protein
MLAVQVVISAEWYVTNSPIQIVQDPDTGYPACGVTRVRFVLLHTYPAVLLVLAFCYGVSVLKIKTNYHEGRWITAATISMMPVYVVWMLLCSFAPAHFHDAATSFAIVVVGLMLVSNLPISISAETFLVTFSPLIFVPKFTTKSYRLKNI